MFLNYFEFFFQIFSAEEENVIEDYMLYASDIYFGLSAIEGRQLAYQFAVRLNKKFPTNWKHDEMAGPDWFEGFMRRHPKLSMRKPEATSMARASAFNRANVKAFFDLYVQVIKKIDYQPYNIWNVDEVGVTTVHKPDRCISRCGRKQVGQITSSERGKLVSLCLAVNAAGMRAPPYLVFPRVRFEDHFLRGGPVGCWGGANKSGFMNAENFFDFMQRFQKFTKCSIQNPILLLLDNHTSHRTLNVLQFCRENGIHVLSFPPHCSHRMQPLDVSVFSPFKRATNKLCKDWVDSHTGQQMSVFDLPPVFSRALEIAVTEANVKSGFRANGTYPLDSQIYQDIDFMPSNTTDRPYTPGSDIIGEEHIPIGADVEVEHNPPQQNIYEDDIDMDATITQQSQPRTPKPLISSQDLSNALKNIRPFPQASPRKVGTRRGRKPGKTSVLTGDEAFNEIQAEQDARDAKQTATEERKAASAAKKVAKKDAAAMNKMIKAAKKALKGPEVPKRVTKRRKTAPSTSYAERSNSEEEE